MSQYFEAAGTTLWNPSNGVASLFLRTADAVAPLVELPTGISPGRADEHEVDPDTFAALVDALVTRYLSSNHPVLRSLLEGFLGPALVLAERAGHAVTALDTPATPHPHDVSVGPAGLGDLGDPARLRELAAAMAQSMPR